MQNRFEIYANSWKMYAFKVCTFFGTPGIWQTVHILLQNSGMKIMQIQYFYRMAAISLKKFILLP